MPFEISEVAFAVGIVVFVKTIRGLQHEQQRCDFETRQRTHAACDQNGAAMACLAKRVVEPRNALGAWDLLMVGELMHMIGHLSSPGSD